MNPSAKLSLKAIISIAVVLLLGCGSGLAQDISGGASLLILTTRPVNPPVPSKTTGGTTPRDRRRPSTMSTADAVDDSIKRGNVARDARNYTEAEKQYRKVLTMAPSDWRAFYGLGNVYHDQNNYLDAVHEYSEVIRLNPKYADARYWLGISLRGLQRNAEAVEQFKQAISMDPQNSRIHYNLANSYFDQNRYREAIDSYKEAIRLKVNLDMVGALYKLGQSYVKTNDKKSAMDQYVELEKLKSPLAKSLLEEINK